MKQIERWAKSSDDSQGMIFYKHETDYDYVFLESKEILFDLRSLSEWRNWQRYHWGHQWN